MKADLFPFFRHNLRVEGQSTINRKIFSLLHPSGVTSWHGISSVHGVGSEHVHPRRDRRADASSPCAVGASVGTFVGEGVSPSRQRVLRKENMPERGGRGGAARPARGRAARRDLHRLVICLWPHISGPDPSTEAQLYCGAV